MLDQDEKKREKTIWNEINETKHETTKEWNEIIEVLYKLYSQRSKLEIKRISEDD